jgi:Holliday junction DNA helicase RuvB
VTVASGHLVSPPADRARNVVPSSFFRLGGQAQHLIGRQNARRILSVPITAAKRRNEPMPHVLMSGPAGLGKTTPARIVATEMNGRLIEMVGSSLKNTAEMTAQLLELRSNAVLFIDEIHALPRKLEGVRLTCPPETGPFAM